MRLATITNWAYGATVALTLASGATMLLASSAQDRERVAIAQRFDLDGATSTIYEDVELLSGLARQFAINGSPADLVAYGREARLLEGIERRTRHIRAAGASSDELHSLHEAMRWADALQDEQRVAIEARSRGERASAVRILFSTEYERELERIRANVAHFQARIDQRTENAVGEAAAGAKLWRSVSEAMLAATGLLFLFVLYFIFRRRVLHPVVKLSDVVGRLAAQDYAAEPPSYDRIDEIGDMAQALRVFRETGIERQRLEQERDRDHAARDLLSRMTQRMQTCDTAETLQSVIRRFIPEVAPQMAGRLYLHDDGRNAMVEVCSWSNPVHGGTEFPVTACWGLRRNRPHQAAGEVIDVPCDHLDQDGVVVPDTLCLPLTSRHGILGLLYFEPRPGADLSDVPEDYVLMLADNISLALDNLMLRDTLRAMAMADPLTTLSNRRELDQSLALLLAESERQDTPISCMMVDIDHFKHFNDDYGHDVGDAVLQVVARTLKQCIRSGDRAYRYGGEEFLLLMPGLKAVEAARRAEDIRAAIAGLRFQHDGREIGPITVSMGIATAPDGARREQLVVTADACLLKAKREGRNRVVQSEGSNGVDAADRRMAG